MMTVKWNNKQHSICTHKNKQTINQNYSRARRWGCSTQRSLPRRCYPDTWQSPAASCHAPPQPPCCLLSMQELYHSPKTATLVQGLSMFKYSSIWAIHWVIRKCNGEWWFDWRKYRNNKCIIILDYCTEKETKNSTFIHDFCTSTYVTLKQNQTVDHFCFTLRLSVLMIDAAGILAYFLSLAG